MTPAERLALDRDGYVVLVSMLDAQTLVRMRAAFEAIVGDQAGGTRHADLRSHHGEFDALLDNERVRAAAEHVLRRPFHVFNFGARDPLQGFGQQGLHTDWYPRSAGDPFAVVTALWLLDDFTAKNGATRVVPGSHRLEQPLPKAMQQPAARHREEKVITAPAGSVLIFNGHLWHSGTKNERGGKRRLLQLQLVADDARAREGLPAARDVTPAPSPALHRN